VRVSYPTMIDDQGNQYLGYALPTVDFGTIPLKISSEVQLNIPGFVYEFLAGYLYGDPGLWYLIYDSNPPIPPDALEAGVTIQIPVIDPGDYFSKVSATIK